MGTFVGAKEGNEVDGTNVGTCVGLGVGLRVGSGFGVGAGVGYFEGFDVVGAGVGLSDGFGVGLVVKRYGFVRINCSMRSRPLRCCMRQRALRAASSAPPHAISTHASARRMVAAQVAYCSLHAADAREEGIDENGYIGGKEGFTKVRARWQKLSARFCDPITLNVPRLQQMLQPLSRLVFRRRPLLLQLFL